MDSCGKEKLNTPSDFTSFSSHTSANILLPPSCFETTSDGVTGGVGGGDGLSVGVANSLNVNNHWKEMMKSVDEIVQNLHNYKQLRSNNAVTGTEVEDRIKPIKESASRDIHLPGSAGVDHSYAFQELSVAVNMLHSQLEQINKCVAEKEHAERLLNEALNEIKGLKVQFDKLNCEKDLIETAHSNTRQQLIAEMNVLRSQHSVELKTLRLQFDDELNEYKQKLAAAKQSADATLADARRAAENEKTDLLTRISDCTHQIEQQEREFHSMKTYMTGLPSTDSLKQEIHEFKASIETLEYEKRNCMTECGLLSTRLSALNDVLVTQEQYLSKDKYNVNTTKKLLLTRWREKVYELLVQLRSTTVSCDQQCNTWSCKLSNTENKLDEAESKYNALLHTVKDKQALCDLKQSQVDHLKVELQKSRCEIDEEKSRHKAAVSSLHEICETVQRTFGLYTNNTEAAIKQLNVKLRSHNNRIGFAAGRLNLVKAEIVRYKAALKTEYSSNESDSLPHRQHDVDIDSEMDELKAELVRVVSERDKLANDVKNDAIELDVKIASATRQAKQEVEELRKRMQQLHSELDETTQDYQNIKHQLMVTKEELADACDEVDRMKMELGKTQIQFQTGLDEAMARMQQQHQEELNLMDKSLQEAKRQHAKAVVSHRQLERQLERINDSNADEMARLQQAFDDKMGQMKARVDSLKTENNLLVATLKQEGLLGRHQSSSVERQAPRLGVTNSLNRESSLRDVIDSAELSEVISDLKKLTAEVIQSEDDD